MDLLKLDGQTTSLIIGCRVGAPPHCLYWGSKILGDESALDVAALTTRQGAHGVADEAIPASLAMEYGLGLSGPSGFSAHRNGRDWGSLFNVQSAALRGNSIKIECADERTALRLTYDIEMYADCDVVTFRSSITNEGAVLTIDEAMTVTLPIPQHFSDLIGFSGRWTKEFETHRFNRPIGSWLRENRKGRTSHDSFPAMILCAPETSEAHGEAIGLHFAWSGNHRLRVDTISDGRCFAGLGALFFPGEMSVAPGETFALPAVVGSYVSDGLNRLSQNFQAHVRCSILSPAMRAKPRPVHYNIWEAVYFDHDTERLKALATRAAALGVERFVLDDGWFGARRDDRAGLGDWDVSPDVYPEGLGPLIDHVVGLGMEMGIWFEPEMVNPDSDLFRAHPDWVQEIDGLPQIPFRNQNVLDISRPEVAAYLFEKIDAILSEYPISYVKWDMNRDLSHPGGQDGKAVGHAHTLALYDLLDRIRAKHPTVEIESCASGGGRIDYGVLARADRVWTSDCNDAIDRQSIQRGASHFLPLEVLGAHVGPGICHQTGRRLSMAMRAGTAIMGHMGLELNLLKEPEAELEQLQQAIALYKANRHLLHHGRLFRLSLPPHMLASIIVAEDQSEALLSIAYLTTEPNVLPPVLKLMGLSFDTRYQLELVWPQGWQPVMSPDVLNALKIAPVSGAALMQAGMQLPLSRPETVLLFKLTAATEKRV